MKKDMKFEEIFVTSKEKANEIMKLVDEKCKNDKAFEEELMTNPTEALQKEGLELKPGFNFQIVKTEDEANALPDNVIPLSFGNKKESLSPDELQTIAGGFDIFGTIGGSSLARTKERPNQIKNAQDYWDDGIDR